MSVTRAQELRKQRQKLYEDNKALLLAVRERWEAREDKGDERRKDYNFDREATAEERAEWDKRDAEQERLKAEIETLEAGEQRAQRHEELGRELTASAGAIGRHIPVSDGAEIRSRIEARAKLDPEAEQRADNDELRRFMLGGIANLTPEQRMDHQIRVARAQAAGLPPELQVQFAELRAQTIGVDSEGGYFGPEGFFNRLTIALKASGGMRAARTTILRTSDGNELQMPTIDDTAGTATQRAEGQEVTEEDVVASRKTLSAYLFDSNLIRVTRELLQDSAFDIGGLLVRLFGERLGRKTNNVYTVGDGVNKPQGLVPATAQGVENASSTALTYNEFIDLKFSVDTAYWPNAQWMFNSSGTYKALKKLVATDGRPIFQPDVQSARVDRIDGDPFIINTDMASPATGNRVALYGDFSYFFIRDVLGVELVTLFERFAEFRQRGYMALLRTDSEYLNPGNDPIKHMRMKP